MENNVSSFVEDSPLRYAMIIESVLTELRADSICSLSPIVRIELYWCGDGYILLYKRLSNSRFQWPRSEAELRLLDPQSFRWLMEGLRIEQKTAIRKGKPKDLF